MLNSHHTFKTSNRRPKLFGAVALASQLLVGLAGAASADTFKLDPVHSMIVFQVNHLGVSNPFGIFHGPTGTVDTAGDGVPSLTISAPVEKIDMGNEKWADDLKAASWFNVKQFPTIDFKTTSVKKSGDNTFDATGDLTLHGVTKTIMVTLTKTGSGKGMQGEPRVGYSTMFKVKREDYGMTTYPGAVGSEIVLWVNLEAIGSK